MNAAPTQAVPTTAGDGSVNGEYLRAAAAGTLADVVAALGRGADLGAVDAQGNTALILAARCNPDMQVASDLIGEGVSLTTCNQDGYSALHGFAAQGADQLIRLALEAGMPVDALCSEQGTPLMLAAMYGHASTARLLLDAGASGAAVYDGAGYTAPDGGLARTPLHLASGGPVIDVLVAAGADIDARDIAGATPLMLRARVRRSEDCAHLIALGARHDARDNEGATVLHYANDSATVAVLLGAGADIDALNQLGETPLFHDIKIGKADVSAREDLIRAGANVNVVGTHGMSMLFCSARRFNIREFLLLLDAGAQPGADLAPVFERAPDLRQAFDAWCARQAMQAALHPVMAPPPPIPAS